MSNFNLLDNQKNQEFSALREYFVLYILEELADKWSRKVHHENLHGDKYIGGCLIRSLVQH